MVSNARQSIGTHSTVFLGGSPEDEHGERILPKLLQSSVWHVVREDLSVSSFVDKRSGSI